MSLNQRRTKTKAAGVTQTGAAQRSADAARKRVTAAKPAPKQTPKKTTGSYVLSAPKGPRTVSHKRIKGAVEKVFRERLVAND